MDKMKVIFSKYAWQFDQDTFRQAEANLERVIDIQQKARKTYKILDKFSGFADLVILTSSDADHVSIIEAKRPFTSPHIFGIGTSNPKPSAFAFNQSIGQDFKIADWPDPNTYISTDGPFARAPLLSNHFSCYAHEFTTFSENVNQQLHYSDVFWNYGFLPAELSKPDRAAKIRDELHALRAELGQCRIANAYLLNEIKSLSRELYNLMRNGVRRYKRILRTGRKILKPQNNKVFSRINRTAVIFILFKIFNDFSGSEEEEGDQQRYAGHIFSFTHSKKHYHGAECQVIRTSRSNHFRQRKQFIEWAA
jgi:hypothetical protein